MIFIHDRIGSAGILATTQRKKKEQQHREYD